MSVTTDLNSITTLTEIFEGKYQEVLVQAENLQKSDFQSAFFSASIRRLSEDSFSLVKAIISQRFPELNSPGSGLAVMLTGSDGRMERTSARAPIELVVVSKEETLSPMASAIRDKISSFVANEGAGLFFRDVEMKCLDRDNVSIHDGRVVKIIPTRALDAQFVGGDESLYVSYKNHLFQEISANRLQNNRSILGVFKKDFLKTALKVMNIELSSVYHSPVKKGSPKKIQKPSVAILVDSGKLQIDGEYLKGPKYGLMRAIQYSVAAAIFQKIHQITAPELKDVPPTICERIDWLARKNFINLSFEECSQLKACYSQGLFWYGQLLFSASRQAPTEPHVASIAVNPAFLRFTLQTALDIIHKMQGENRAAAASSKQV